MTNLINKFNRREKPNFLDVVELLKVANFKLLDTTDRMSFLGSTDAARMAELTDPLDENNRLLVMIDKGHMEVYFGGDGDNWTFRLDGTLSAVGV